MGKDFFEVFPTLKLSEDTSFLLKDVRVTKVSTNSTRDFIRIYLFSTHLLQKKKIYELEYEIKQQLFDRSMIRIEILESYQLSEQYTPENLMHEYYDSILLELEKRSAVEKSMFEHADCDFEDSVLNLKLQNSIVAEGKKDSIVSLLSEVFNDRFHIPLSIKVAYQPPKKKSALEFNEIQLQAEVDEILERNEALRQEKKQLSEEKEEGANETKKEKEASSSRQIKEKRFGKEPRKSFIKRDFRKSDDPKHDLFFRITGRHGNDCCPDFFQTSMKPQCSRKCTITERKLYDIILTCSTHAGYSCDIIQPYFQIIFCISDYCRFSGRA